MRERRDYHGMQPNSPEICGTRIFEQHMSTFKEMTRKDFEKWFNEQKTMDGVIGTRGEMVFDIEVGREIVTYRSTNKIATLYYVACLYYQFVPEM